MLGVVVAKLVVCSVVVVVWKVVVVSIVVVGRTVVCIVVVTTPVVVSSVVVVITTLQAFRNTRLDETSRDEITTYTLTKFRFLLQQSRKSAGKCEIAVR